MGRWRKINKRLNMDRTREYLKGRFENGKFPDEQDFGDLIESALNKAEDVADELTDGTPNAKVLTAGAVKPLKANVDAVIGSLEEEEEEVEKEVFDRVRNGYFYKGVTNGYTYGGTSYGASLEKLRRLGYSRLKVTTGGVKAFYTFCSGAFTPAAGSASIALADIGPYLGELQDNGDVRFTILEDTTDHEIELPEGSEDVLFICDRQGGGDTRWPERIVGVKQTEKKGILGDVEGLKEAVEELKQKGPDQAVMRYGAKTVEVAWEQGHLLTDGTDGGSAAASYPLRVRTGYLPASVERVESYASKEFRVYACNKNHTGEAVRTDWTARYADFDHARYDYRLEARKINSPDGTIAPADVRDGIVILGADVRMRSAYRRDVAYGFAPACVYHGLQGESGYAWGDANTTTTEVLAQYDTLLGDYITKEAIGTASDGTTMWVYKTNPAKHQFFKGQHRHNHMIKVLVVCGQDGFEKNSMFAMFYLLKDLNGRYMQNDGLKYLRQHVQLMVVPCANPYSIDYNTATYFADKVNARGVWLNRNYPVREWEGPEHGGTAAGSEPEVQAIVGLIQANRDMVLALDYHNNGGHKPDARNGYNWMSVFYRPDDPYTYHFVDMCQMHLEAATALLHGKYQSLVGGGENDALCSLQSATPWETNASTRGTLEGYLAEQNILGGTFEGFVQFDGDAERYSASSKQANCELVGNFLIEFMNFFSKVQ